jgi:hypothetical protein
MKEIQAARKEIQASRKEIQARWKEIQIRRKENQGSFPSKDQAFQWVVAESDRRQKSLPVFRSELARRWAPRPRLGSRLSNVASPVGDRAEDVSPILRVSIRTDASNKQNTAGSVRQGNVGFSEATAA